MSLETKSLKRNRIYKRKFDHEEAIARYHAGESAEFLAKEYDVSDTAIRRIVNKKVYTRLSINSRKFMMSGVCIDCGKKGISRYAERCSTCNGINTRLKYVREKTLWCGSCKRWLFDLYFGKTKRKECILRRGRASCCKECVTRKRRIYRAKHTIPCKECGKPIEGKGASSKKTRTFLCKKCWKIKNRPLGFWENLTVETLQIKNNER